LSTHLRLGLPSGLFPSGFPTNILYVFFITIRATFPANLILYSVCIRGGSSWPLHRDHSDLLCLGFHLPSLGRSNYTWRRVQVMKLLIMQFSTTSCHFISLRSKYFLNTLFSNTLSLCSSLNVRNGLPYPSRTKGEIIVSNFSSNF
jgi:hypothetical protein